MVTKLSWKSAKSFFNNSQLKTLNFSFKIFLLIFDSVWCKIWAIRQKYSTNAKSVAFFGQLWSFVFLDLRSEKEISTKIIKFKKLQRFKVNKKKSEIKETFCEENPATILWVFILPQVWIILLIECCKKWFNLMDTIWNVL